MQRFERDSDTDTARLPVLVEQGEQVFRVRAGSRYGLAVTEGLLDSLTDLVGPSHLAFVRQ